jgi:hypothetical protein
VVGGLSFCAVLNKYFISFHMLFSSEQREGDSIDVYLMKLKKKVDVYDFGHIKEDLIWVE